MNIVRVCASCISGLCSCAAQVMTNICKAAGVVLLRMIRTPMAVVLKDRVCNLRSDSLQKYTMLVVDLGGGCLDVAGVEVSGSKALMLCGVGSSKLGVHDFCNALCDHLAKTLNM